MSAATQDYTRRFAGLEKLYGSQGLRRLAHSHIVVIGVGGVGSWTAESLARSGVGQLTLIDPDHLVESNINRQLPALDSTLGKAKVQALKDRVEEINSRCRVNCVESYIEEANITALLEGLLNQASQCVVIDCIDQAKAKAALIAWCSRNKLPILTVGAAGACIDPLQIRLADLSRTQNDLLLSRTRKHLRQQHSFSRNLKRRFGVPAVFSIEQRISDQTSTIRADHVATDLSCAGYGSVVHVTASLGFNAAAKAIEMLTAARQGE